MTATTGPAAGLGAWRIATIGVVGILATGIGATAGAFLLTDRAVGAGPAARYVLSTAPLYLEVRLDPSAEQDAALRELLGRFPPIDGLDLDRPLYEQVGELVDEGLADEADTDVRWSEDIAPWFDGSLAFAVTDLPLEEMADAADELDPSMDDVPPGMLVVAGVTDADAARTSIARLLAESGAPATETTETSHRGVTITTIGDTAYAVTDDAVLLAPDVAGIAGALDVAADPETGLAAAEHVRDVAATLPADWLAYAAFDFSEVMSASLALGDEGAGAAAMAELLEQQSMRGAMVVSATDDGLAFDGAADAATGAFAPSNADRGLAGAVPADTLYFADGGNVGAMLGAVIEAATEAAAEDPEAAEQIEMAEAALGADLEELVAWIDDGAVAAGWDDEPWIGFVLVPSDVDAAERRLGQLATFAGLAALDPSTGLSVERTQIAGTEVTTIRWSDANASSEMGLPTVDGLVVQYAVADDRAFVGIGDRFVGRALELDPADSLAEVDRYAATVADLGGADNAGTVWLDLAAARASIVAALGPMMAFIDPDGEFAETVEPWLLPLDRYAAVSVLEGDIVVQRAVLYVE